MQARLRRDAECKPGTREEAPLPSLNTHEGREGRAVFSYTWLEQQADSTAAHWQVLDVDVATLDGKEQADQRSSQGG